MTLLSQRFPRVDLLRDVADDLEGCLGGQIGVASDIASELAESVAVIRHYLVPRLEDRTAPFNVVFAGPTGSGKSTLVNSVVGRQVSRSGVLRPTTTRPLFYSKRGTERPRAIGPVDVDLATGDARILQFVSLIDTPDIDSTRAENRRAALDLIAAADLVVFVASSLRYADLVPWEVIRSVSGRGIPIIPVLNRVTAETAGARVDLARRLRGELGEVEVTPVMEHRIDSTGVLPRSAVAPLRARILDSVSRLDRTGCLDRSMEAVRSSLTSVAHRLNADLVRPGPPTPLDTPGEGAAALAERWKERVDSASGLLERALRPRHRRVVLETVAGEVREYLVTMVERDVRLAARERGEIVIDLTGDDMSVHLDSIDRSVEEWFDGLSDPGADELTSKALQRRVEAAIEQVAALAEGEDEGAGDLRRRVDEIRSAVGEGLLGGTPQAAVLEEVQRARARIRPDV